MPAALVVPWDEIKDAYCKGTIPLAEISERFGVKGDTIRKRGLREGWQRARIVATRHAERVVAKVAEEHARQALALVGPAIEQAAREWQAESANVAQLLRSKVKDHLNHECPADDLQKLAGALDRVDNVGRRSLGLDKDAQGNSMTVMVGVGVIRPDGSIGIQRDECVPGDCSQDSTALTLEAELVAKSPV